MANEYVGIDCSKTRLDVGVRPSGESGHFGNDEAGLSECVAWLKDLAPTVVVIEASGGLEMPLVIAGVAAGVPIAVVNPRQVRDFAKASNRLAKTDKIDAHVIAHFAQALEIVPRALPDEETRMFHEMVLRRKQLVDNRAQEKNRREQLRGAMRANVMEHIKWLDEQISKLDIDIRGHIRLLPVWRDKDELLRSAPGVGDTTSAMLIADLPELGRLSHREIAAMVGVAPFNNDSGSRAGKRAIWGGRAQVRSGLYMATLAAIRHNPVIQLFYQRLIGAGKHRKVALVACMRKLLCILNAMVRHGEKWNPDRYAAIHA